MVNKIEKKGRVYFQCDRCKFVYKTENLAEKCENYCRKYKACSLEITKNAINI